MDTDWRNSWPEEGQKHILDTVTFLKSVISTSKVLTASSSVTGRRIQIRVQYIHNGKKRLGYYSNHLNSVVKKLSPGVEGFLKKVSCLEKRAKGYASNMYQYSHVCIKVLDEEDPQWKSKFLPVINEAIEKMHQVAISGQPQRNTESHLHKKAADYLSGALKYAITNGVTEVEVSDMLKIALVENTLDS